MGAQKKKGKKQRGNLKKKKEKMKRGAFYGVIASFLWFKMNLPVWFILVVLTSVYVAMGGYKFFRMFFRTCVRDFVGLSRYVRVQLTVRNYARNNMTVPRLFE